VSIIKINRLIMLRRRTGDTYFRNYSTLEYTMWQNADLLNLKHLSNTFATGLEVS